MRHPQAVRPVRPGGVRGPLALLGIVLAVLVVGGPAAAHDVLLGSDPEDGSVVTEVPEQVVLTFSAPQTDIGAQVEVTAEGETWSDGPAIVDGTTVTQPLRVGMPSGEYTVQWRSVASDGHPVSGELSFTVDLPAESDPEPEPTVEPEPEPEPEIEPSAPEPTATLSASEIDVADRDSGVAPWLLAAGGVLLLATAVVVIAWRRQAAATGPVAGDEVADD